MWPRPQKIQARWLSEWLQRARPFRSQREEHEVPPRPGAYLLKKRWLGRLICRVDRLWPVRRAASCARDGAQEREDLTELSQLTEALDQFSQSSVIKLKRWAQPGAQVLNGGEQIHRPDRVALEIDPGITIDLQVKQPEEQSKRQLLRGLVRNWRKRSRSQSTSTSARFYNAAPAARRSA